ncbi:hypothetical protein AB0M39_17000 [Streptomyces sp. NPDC051907]|uniref:hypothetical protein n=1 Tax=Streptomyces sp. NPDC051907 TaxID=3155284 RepID=UPI003414E362
MQEAAQRADDILDRTFGAIKPSVQWMHFETTSDKCTVTRRRSVLTVITPERNGDFLGLVDRHWKGQGFEFVAASRDSLSAFYETSDGFSLHVIIGGRNQAHFEITTPCVKESKVSPSTSKPSGPEYTGQEIPPPSERSEFWSGS